MKTFKIITLSLCLIVVCVITYLHFSIKNYKENQVKEKNKSEQFLNQIKIADNQTFDLRQYSQVNWDQVIILEPYSSICQQGINGYSKDSSNCETFDDEASCKLLFLNKNNLVEKITIRRSIIDFADAGINQKRIDHSNAVFSIKGNKVTLKD